MDNVPQYKPPEQKSAADIEGPWVDPGVETGLIARCRRYWTTPISQLPNEMLATFLRQNTALAFVVPEAERRIEAGIDDDSELYDGELETALRKAQLKRGSAD